MAEAQKKLPAIQWYPGDWRKDPGVQSSDYHHRGVWFEVLMLMWESEDRGRLKLNGRPMPDSAIARLLGLPADEWVQVRATLLEYGVASEDDDGALISRRMVRDELKRRQKVEAGRKGGRASRPPAPAKQDPKQTPSREGPSNKGHRRVNESGSQANAKRKPTPSVSVSASASTSVGDIKHPPSSSNSEEAESKQKREDVEDLELEIRKHQPQAKLNIIAIHGGTEDPVTIEGHEVGVGLEIEVYKRLCRDGRDPPDIIAAAIAHIPAVSDLEPPVSLARWGADDGMPIYEQCVGRAYKGMPSTIGVPAKTMPPTSSDDVVSVEKRKLEQRKQLDQVQREREIAG